MPQPGHSIAVELAVQDARGAEIARALGADRIELCSALALGGLTPSRGLIERAIEVGPPVHVLIRPRAGGFVYTRQEVETILADIRHAREAGAAGVVVGALTPAGAPDLEVLERCVAVARGCVATQGYAAAPEGAAAAGIEVTFHRAIDVSADIRRSAELLRGRGVHRILTSGGAATAFAGREVLADLVKTCGNEVEVQAGAGITPSNVRAVAATGAAAVHFSATRGAHPAPILDEGTRGSGGVDFGTYATIDADLAAQTIAALTG